LIGGADLVDILVGFNLGVEDCALRLLYFAGEVAEGLKERQSTFTVRPCSPLRLKPPWPSSVRAEITGWLVCAARHPCACAKLVDAPAQRMVSRSVWCAEGLEVRGKLYFS
jgi:hypothetical protein